jgi:small subunit ribosomal protein S7
MPRKGEVRRREVLPDPRFHDRVVTRFVNNMMEAGKKSVAERIFYRALDLIQQRANEDPLGIFKRAVDNAKPAVEVRSRRVGGATYQVPVEVRPARRLSLAMRWLISNAHSRTEKSMAERLAAELMDASSGRGGTIKKKDDTHRMAEANKAFAHYRW